MTFYFTSFWSMNFFYQFNLKCWSTLNLYISRAWWTTEKVKKCVFTQFTLLWTKLSPLFCDFTVMCWWQVHVIKCFVKWLERDLSSRLCADQIKHSGSLQRLGSKCPIQSAPPEPCGEGARNTSREALPPNSKIRHVCLSVIREIKLKQMKTRAINL